MRANGRGMLWHGRLHIAKRMPIEGIESDAKGSVGMAIAYSNINANNEWDAGDARLRPIRPPMRREASRQAAKRYAERQSKIKENGYAGRAPIKNPPR